MFVFHPGHLWSLFLLVYFALYFVPTIVAAVRRSHLVVPVAAVNLLFGWTFIGWVIALVMALIRPSGPSIAPPSPYAPQGGPILSPDGRYLWNGYQWIPAGPPAEVPPPPGPAPGG